MNVYSDASYEDLSDEMETLGWDSVFLFPVMKVCCIKEMICVFQTSHADSPAVIGFIELCC